MVNSEVVLKATGLTLGYGARAVLQGVNLEVRRGEFWFLLGPNGEGKTTLIKALLGMLRPWEGALWIRPECARRGRIGFVPQRCDLNPTLRTTVREFVLLGLVGVAADRRAVEERLGWALARTDLTVLVGRDYGSLSGGQRQRALVARALVRRPELLIVDEPTNGLDLVAEDEVLQALTALNRSERLTVLFVTHHLDIAASFGSHFALFAKGAVQAGTSEQVLTREALRGVYGAPVELRREPGGGVVIRINGAARVS
jgi:ABC-type cobalamin/Fe3+-siderophores transport system ATPase subunit